MDEDHSLDSDAQESNTTPRIVLSVTHSPCVGNIGTWCPNVKEGRDTQYCNVGRC